MPKFCFGILRFLLQSPPRCSLWKTSLGKGIEPERQFGEVLVPEILEAGTPTNEVLRGQKKELQVSQPQLP
ncbi:MAG: hypothetical protein ACI9HK_005941 [Pirellulaceae bacterium]|jgi:hypothetical protein